MNEAIEKFYNHAIEKFGKNGYATKKFLDELQYLIEHKDEFYEVAKLVFHEVKEEIKLDIKEKLN